MASSTGQTAVDFLRMGCDAGDLVVVTSQHGFREPGEPRILRENRTRLEESGVTLVFATHVLPGIDRAINRQYQGITPTQLISQVLKMFGEGVKVCLEMAVMPLTPGPFRWTGMRCSLRALFAAPIPP